MEQGYRFPDRKVEKVDLPGPFTLKLPEIYQIELTSDCNFECTMCPRKLYSRRDNTRYLDIGVVEKMCERGDFDGSYFVELQMAGEPLLHKDLHIINSIIKQTGCFTGLSTNGHLLKSHDILPSLALLDYITISIDSVTHREWIRRGSDPFKLWYEKVLKPAVIYLWEAGVSIDIQFIELDNWPDELAEYGRVTNLELKKITKLRTVPDCFITKFNPIEVDNEKGLCLNPFLSCSIQCNGNVVPCCFAWGDDIIYGNIRHNSLKEIWEGEAVQVLRQNHLQRMLPELCFQCYMRSPVLLHWQIYFDSLKNKRKESNYVKNMVRAHRAV